LIPFLFSFESSPISELESEELTACCAARIVQTVMGGGSCADDYIDIKFRLAPGSGCLAVQSLSWNVPGTYINGTSSSSLEPVIRLSWSSFTTCSGNPNLKCLSIPVTATYSDGCSSIYTGQVVMGTC